MFTCGVCHGNEGHGEFVEEVFRVDGRYVLVGSVPSTVCQRCGERSFSRETTERVRQLGPWRIQGGKVRTHAGVRFRVIATECGNALHWFKARGERIL